VITKVLFSAAVALSAAAWVATPAGADPSAFGTLSCSCGGGVSAAVGGPTVTDQMNEGIQSGLSDLQGISG
jgi:hypothetical protein